jgi:ribosomal protein S18 acetylase RimI-like enzyme
MTESEFAEHRQRSVSSFAAEQVQAGDWTPDAALGLAEQQFDELLPDGIATPEMVLLVGEIDGQVVGWVWVGATPRERPGWWIYDIEVGAEFRGAGYGRTLLGVAEDEARRAGVDSIGLNVFGGNDVARALYDSAGYQVTSAQMRKPLST